MKTNFTFDGVCKFLENNHPELKKDVDALTSLLVLLSPLCISFPAASVLIAINSLADLLSVKDGIIKIGKRLFDKITSKISSPDDKFNRMQTAYVLICFTSFFDALEKTLPQIMQQLKIQNSEKQLLAKIALEKFNSRENIKDSEEKELITPEIIKKEIELPHPANLFSFQKRQLISLYEELSKGFENFLEKFIIWEKAKDEDITKLKEILTGLPKIAFEKFEVQYFNLAEKFEEFFIWTNLQEHKDIQEKIQKFSLFLQKHIELSSSNFNNIDVGMKNLSDLIIMIPTSTITYEANKAIQELRTSYLNKIDEPVVPDKYEKDISKQYLSFPKKSEIFIPQSFKVIRYPGVSLEDNTTWKDEPVRNDLGTFLLSYFSSPYSVLNPLIILGHPGSGKSLLSSIIATRFGNPYTPIRVALRDVEADSEISVQIEEQIRKDTQRDVSWANLTDVFNNKPSLIIFDGYDELLQASGKVYSGYLRKVQKFQENELQLGRKPVRTIVTSRLTLIDKADIPNGATIIRLLPFDNNKQVKWASIWNNLNKKYFEQNKIKSFTIPSSGKLLELAEQPLLLLMLAIFDSENNQLQNSKELEQTVLYDKLLRRFIKRELEKDEKFFEISEEDRINKIEYEMERLGIAALGMFNRRKLHIKVSELNKDLTFFELEKKKEKITGTTLSEADLLLGSFFFVHESKSGNINTENNEYGRDISFEFLHNTFGEFLTAEFILRKIIKVCNVLFKLGKADLGEERAKKLNDPDEFPSICLAFAPLFSRPMILTMMREWIKHKLIYDKFNHKDFLNELSTVVNSELQRLLTKNQLSKVLLGNLMNNPYPSFPILGSIAIYSLNLILIRTVISEEGYYFDEDKILPYPDGARAWDRLIFLWRSWFSIENLNGAAAIIFSNRILNNIQLFAKDSFGLPLSYNRLDTVLNVSTALSDDILAGMAGIISYDAYKHNTTSLDDAKNRLKYENIDVEIEYLIRKLRDITLNGDKDLLIEVLFKVSDILYRCNKFSGINHEKVIILLKNSIRYANIFFGRSKAIELFDAFYVPVRGDIPISFEVITIQLGFEIDHIAFLDWRYRKLIDERDFSEYPLDLILEFINLANKFDNRKLSSTIYFTYLKKYKNISSTSFKNIIIILKLALKFKDIKFLRKFYEDNLRKDRLDKEFSDELIVLTLRIAYLLNDKSFINNFYHKSRDLEIRETFFLDLNIINILKLAREFNDIENIKENIIFIFETFHIKSELPEESVFEILKIALELKDSKISKNIYKTYLREYKIWKKLPDELLIETLKIAKLLEDNDFLEELNKYFFDNIKRKYLSIELVFEIYQIARNFNNTDTMEYLYQYFKNNYQSNINLLPVKYFKEAKEIATKFNDDEMLNQIQFYLA